MFNGQCDQVQQRQIHPKCNNGMRFKQSGGQDNAEEVNEAVRLEHEETETVLEQGYDVEQEMGNEEDVDQLKQIKKTFIERIENLTPTTRETMEK